VDLFALVCDVWRSVNRFVVPRIAPKLEAGAPGAPEVADCAFSAVFVLPAAEFWPNPAAAAPAEEVDAEDVEVELAVADDELAAGDPVPTDFVPPAPKPPEALRLPRRRGAMSAANFSAVTSPLTRIVRSRSPAAIVTARNSAIAGFAAPIWWRLIQAAPAIAARANAIRNQRQPCRGFSGNGRRSSGAAGGSTVPGRLRGNEALLV